MALLLRAGRRSGQVLARLDTDYIDLLLIHQPAENYAAGYRLIGEKQYPYKVSKKKVYMTPSAAEAQGLVRADKHPKVTRYGRQNPISERWNSEEQLAAWRADVSNHYLECAGRQERIDHRSNTARGLDEKPTIHEGVTERALERKGIIADRCEINRQIKADNVLLRELNGQEAGAGRKEYHSGHCRGDGKAAGRYDDFSLSAAAYRSGQAAHERLYPRSSAKAGTLYRAGSGGSGEEQGRLLG